jgi:phage tail protein X
MIIYQTKEYDIIDWICWKHYGFTSGSVEEVLRTNQCLAEFDDYLPDGLLIKLPEINKTNLVKTIKLWD